MSEEKKRYFKADDGASYWIIARSLEHAKQILDDAGVDFDSEGAEIVWSEMTPDDVAKVRITQDDAHNRITSRTARFRLVPV